MCFLDGELVGVTDTVGLVIVTNTTYKQNHKLDKKIDLSSIIQQQHLQRRENRCGSKKLASEDDNTEKKN